MVFRHSASRGRCLGVVLLVVVASCCIGASAIGVNYGTVADDLPTPAQVVQLIQSTYISKVKIYSTDPTIISAFADSGISLVVGATNDEIEPLAASAGFAQQWVTTKVAAHYPSTNIICVVVGNEVLTAAPNSTYQLVGAMQNIHTGLTNLGLDGKIKVSTPHSVGVLAASYPPSDGIFRTDLSGPVFSPMLDFLAQTGAPFMINAYPYFAYRDDPKISISYALFQPDAAVVDTTTGLRYNDLFDAQVDAVYAAMAKLGHQDISVTVSETGWPSFGDSDEVGVGVTNAQTYISNLLQHINTNAGTPNRPGVPIDTYIFALFNENQKPGPTSERNFGLFEPDETVVYDVGLVTKSTNESSTPPPPMVSTTPSPPPPDSSSPSPSSTPASPPPTTSPPPAGAPPFSSGSPPPPATESPPSTSPPPSSTPPTSEPAPSPQSDSSPPPPYTAPPPPYPVPHVPPTGGSTPSPPPKSTTPPPPASSSSPPPASSSSPPPASSSSPPPASSSSPPPEASSPPPAAAAPPPPSFFAPPPGSNSNSPPPASPSSPPPTTTSPPPGSPPPTETSPPPATSPPSPPVSSSPPPSPAPPSPESPPPTTPAPPSPASKAPPGTPPAPPGTPSGPNTWCVGKPGAPATALATALNYACGEGGADCSEIQAGASCYNPNTLFSHASYAFSSYYAKNGRNYWNCFFGNSSLITITNPSYANCDYP